MTLYQAVGSCIMGLQLIEGLSQRTQGDTKLGKQATNGSDKLHPKWQACSPEPEHLMKLEKR
jgi:hypothetical protein